ncbi:MAG: UvrD-helicase domain-containing protein, partial [Thermoleophilia bacterium]|nr:UvrD-helicase domain-containing protein [Thermoleophilia bacterium]
MPVLVQQVVDVPDSSGLTVEAPSPEQLAAIEESGVVFVSAGAGTGKTTVLVERFVRAVVERELPLDSILVITYTERAAGELRSRIRQRLTELGRRELSAEIDRAWISTIHAFCSRLLRAHPFEAGLDPNFRVLDEPQALVLRSEAFSEALAAFLADRRPERLRLLATYGSRRLATMLFGAYERLRSAGRPLQLAGAEPRSIADAAGALRECARAALADAGEDAEGTALVARALDLVGPDGALPPPERLLDLGDLRVPERRSEGFASYHEALAALESAALDAVAARDRDLLQALLVELDRVYAEAKERESALDFEDLQLRARALLRADAGVRERTRWRFRSVMVDEFQDTNRLQCELVDELACDELFFVGDEFQSIYRFRHADVEVFRERRSRSPGVLALTRNYRSRPEVLAVVNHLFGTE